ncbi:unnamed protein product, partial [Ixodes persulcatus]
SPFLLLDVSCARSSVLEYFFKVAESPDRSIKLQLGSIFSFSQFRATCLLPRLPPSPLPGKSPLLLASGGCCVGFYGGAAAPLTSAAACCRYRPCTIAGGPHGSDVFFCGAVAT